MLHFISSITEVQKKIIQVCLRYISIKEWEKIMDHSEIGIRTPRVEIARHVLKISIRLHNEIIVEYSSNMLTYYQE